METAGAAMPKLNMGITLGSDVATVVPVVVTVVAGGYAYDAAKGIDTGKDVGK